MLYINFVQFLVKKARLRYFYKLLQVGRVRHKLTDEEKIAKVYEGQANESDVIIKELAILRLLKQKNLIQLKEVFKSNQ